MSIITSKTKVTVNERSIGKFGLISKRSKSLRTGISKGSVQAYIKRSSVPPCPGNQESMARTNSTSIESEQNAEMSIVTKLRDVCINKPPIFSGSKPWLSPKKG